MSQSLVPAVETTVVDLVSTAPTDESVAQIGEVSSEQVNNQTVEFDHGEVHESGSEPDQDLNPVPEPIQTSSEREHLNRTKKQFTDYAVISGKR